VDDALALLNAVVAHVPEADSTRIAAFGRSRGGGVMLLMAARDPRIRVVVSAYGTTDFLLPEVRRLRWAAGWRACPGPGSWPTACSLPCDGRTTVPVLVVFPARWRARKNSFSGP
jgi:hypothetical protein